MAGGPTSSGGRTIHWILHDILGYNGDFQPLIERALAKSNHPSPLMFLPYLDGERTPIWDSSALGAFFGLSLAHNREDLITAVIEGITLGLKDILERIKAAGVNLNSAAVYGKQSQNPGWNQLKADAFGIPVYVPLVKEATCLGAAAIAGWGIGMWPDVAAAGKSLSKVEYTCIPTYSTASAWSEKLFAFRELYQRTRNLIP
jgi:xylulokinase